MKRENRFGDMYNNLWRLGFVVSELIYRSIIINGV